MIIDILQEREREREEDKSLKNKNISDPDFFISISSLTYQ